MNTVIVKYVCIIRLTTHVSPVGCLEDARSGGDAASRTPQAQAVELICRCDEIPDEGVELHILKGLLTASTSSSFTIHGQVRGAGEGAGGGTGEA